MSSDDKLIELPKLTYSEREDVLTSLLLARNNQYTEESEAIRLNDLYNKIQSHF